MRLRPRLFTLLSLVLAGLGVACASTPRSGATGSDGGSDGGVGMRPLLEAVAARDHPALHTGALTVLERCGTAPLGQQALLLLAAGELDPRNARGRPDVAREASAILFRGVEPGSWSGALAASLHLVALRLGAEKGGLYAAAERDLRAHVERGSQREAAEASVTCRAAPWPEIGAGSDPPSMRGRSYPEIVGQLQRQVAELEAELERLRRITQEP